MFHFVMVGTFEPNINSKTKANRIGWNRFPLVYRISEEERRY